MTRVEQIQQAAAAAAAPVTSNMSDRLLHPRPTFWRPSGVLLIVLALGCAASAIGMVVIGNPFAGVRPAVDGRLAIGGLGFLLMLLLILIRTPIAMSLIVPALLGLYSIGGSRLLQSLAGSDPYNTVASWSLSVLPMFILMGLIISSSGIAENLFRVAQQWLWWLPGGLAVGTNIAGVGLAAVTGSTLATSYALGRVGVPEMLRAGYHKMVAMVAIMATGLSGQLLPPGILLIIYAGLVEAPVGPQLLAGIVPGVGIALLFSIVMFLVALILGEKGGGRVNRQFKVPLPAMLRSLGSAWPVPVLIVLIVGGMFSGVFTATEAGAGAAFAAILLGLGIAIKRKSFESLREGMVDTLQTVGMMFLILLGAQFLTDMFLQTGISTAFQQWVVSAGFNRTTFLLVMIVFYVILGLAMDTLAMLLLTVPVLVPTLQALDIPLIFFGVFVILLAEVANISPPVGLLLFVLHDMFQDPKVNLGQKISLNDVFNSVWLVTPGAILMLVLMIFFPDIVMFLPNLSSAAAAAH